MDTATSNQLIRYFRRRKDLFFVDEADGVPDQLATTI